MFGYGYVASLAQLCHPAAVSCYEVGLFHITKLRLFYSGEQASTGSNSRPAPVRSGLRGRGQVSEAIQRLMSWSHQASELYTGAPFGGRLQQQLKLDDFPFLGPGGVKGLPPQTSQAPAARRERQQFAVSRAHWFKDLQASADIGSALGGIHPAGTLPCPDHLPSASTGLDKTASVMSWLSKQPHDPRSLADALDKASRIASTKSSMRKGVRKGTHGINNEEGRQVSSRGRYFHMALRMLRKRSQQAAEISFGWQPMAAAGTLRGLDAKEGLETWQRPSFQEPAAPQDKTNDCVQEHLPLPEINAFFLDAGEIDATYPAVSGSAEEGITLETREDQSMVGDGRDPEGRDGGGTQVRGLGQFSPTCLAPDLAADCRLLFAKR
ncbi:hypothetical protein AK812_SmicGene12077 [Symbiodinium microadriaticum]|uniref:Uncharacterized protein n=1 Tax=Symbiodinium microadriaticum TaxID=2951 RepID=A0A1Q9EBN5_SYMMI|nr:hypothetical protein AK812_SmicGene12077 [Symbiodinium microadriaticum]